jgi:hypothetical protein
MYQRVLRIALACCGCLAGLHLSAGAAGFEGKIHAEGGRTGAVNGLLYTVGTNCMRVEMTDTNFPNAIDLVDLGSGQITLVQPMNHTYLRFQPNAAPVVPGGRPMMMPSAPPQMPPPQPAMPPGLPPGIGPTNLPGMPAMPQMPQMPQMPNGAPPGVGPQAAPGGPAMPAMASNPGMNPAMGMRRPMITFQLQAADGQTNLLGYECRRYLIQQRGETMDIWATDKLLPFQVYLPNQPPSFGMPMMEFQWSKLLAEKKLFPLYASMRGDNGVELYRFEVQSIEAGHLTEAEAQGQQPPGNYIEIQPRPF